MVTWGRFIPPQKEVVLKKKSILNQEAAGEAVRQMLVQLNTNAQEIGARSDGVERVQKLCKQLCEFSMNLLEWGEHRGNVEIWASFVPSMFDYQTDDSAYGEDDHV